MKKNVNSLIMKKLGQKPVAFNPVLGRLAESANAGLFMSQMLYWNGKGRNKEYIYKTIKEFQMETCLNRSEQDRAIKIWTTLGVIEVKRKGVPPKRHFKIKIPKLLELLNIVNLDEMTNEFAQTSKSIWDFDQNITESIP